MEKSLTEGNSLKQILYFAFPLLLGNLFQQLYNLASVGASSSLNFLILGFCMGLCGGFAIPVAQTFGAKEYSLMRRYVVNASVLAAGISIAIAVVTALFCRQTIIIPMVYPLPKASEIPTSPISTTAKNLTRPAV